MNALNRSRTLLGGLAILAYAALGFALFSQYVLGMQPCAWCILQRIICLAIGIIATVGWFVQRRPVLQLAGLLTLLLAAGGIMAAWYQRTVAANQFSCDLTFADRFVTVSGLDRLAPQLFGIYATCAESATSLLGIRYEFWTLALFILMLLWSATILMISCRRAS